MIKRLLIFAFVAIFFISAAPKEHDNDSVDKLEVMSLSYELLKMSIQLKHMQVFAEDASEYLKMCTKSEDIKTK